MSISIKSFVIVVQSLSPVQLVANSWTAAYQAHLSSTISWNLLRLTSIESVMLSISFSSAPFYFCLQSFPAPGTFLMNQLFASGSQSIGASASASVLSMNIQDWFSLGLIGLVSLLKGLSKIFYRTTVQKHEFFGAQPSLGFLGGSDGKESTWKAEDLGSIPGLGRSPRGKHGNPLQNSCLVNPHGQRNLADCSSWGHNELDMTEWLSTAQPSFWSSSQIHIWLLDHQFSSVAESCPTLWNAMSHTTPGSLSIKNSWSLPKLMSIKSVMQCSHLILCHPLLLLPPILSIRVFYNESTLCMRWLKYWGLGFKISPSNEHPGLISFRMHWLDLLAVQGTLKSLL